LPTLRRYLSMAEQELSRVSEITRQTLGFYRDTSAPRAVELSELVEGVLLIYRSKVEAKNLAVQSALQPEVIVVARPGELKQVISNLVLNAVEACPAHGALKVRVRRRGNRVHITVADNGSGILTADRKRIFEPFFTTRKHFGTGLGLWVAKGIVEKLGGSILVRSSTSAGRSGSVFTVVLNAAANAVSVSNRAA
jgi:signal transduction histidine kinase